MSSKIKILIVTYGFFPEIGPRSFRATELSKEFCRQGYEVSILAPYREGMEELFKQHAICHKNLGKLKWKIFNFKSLGTLGRLYNRIVNRLLPLLFEFPMIELFFKVRKAIKAEKEKYDLLISIATPYPIHWGVASVWRKGGDNIAKRWVADCGDPYCLQENDTFQPPFYFNWVEKWFMRKADFVSVPTENSFKGYFPEFYSKLRIIPQGFRFEDIEKRPVIDDGIIRFGYGGSFIPRIRDPKEFILFLTKLPKQIRFEFHIYTPSHHLVKPYINGDARIILHQPIERKKLLYVLSGFDFVVNFANTGTAQTPSKLIDYVIIDKPILNIETGNLDTNSIYEFLVGNYASELKVIESKNYRIENVAQSFLKLI